VAVESVDRVAFRYRIESKAVDFSKDCGIGISFIDRFDSPLGRSPMPLIQLVVVLVVVGVMLWVVNSYIPMQSTMKNILNAVVIIAVILWLLSVFGIIGSLQGIRIGR
jgi:hypothetical protein